MDEAMGGAALFNQLPVETTMYTTTSIEKIEGKKVYIMGKMFDGERVFFFDSKRICRCCNSV